MNDVEHDLGMMNSLFDGSLDSGEGDPGNNDQVDDNVDDSGVSGTGDDQSGDLDREDVSGSDGDDLDSGDQVVDKDEKDKIIDDLRTRISRLEEDLRSKLDSKADSGPESGLEEEPMQFDAQSFVDDSVLDDAVRNPAEFNKILNNVYQKAVMDSRKAISEKVLLTIPDIVKNNIVTMMNLRAASESFYNNNEDLKPFKKTVAAVFEEMASENPGKSYMEIMKSLGPEVRKRLGLHKQAAKKSRTGNSPRLPRKGSRSGAIGNKPSLSGMEAELAEMNKVLGM